MPQTVQQQNRNKHRAWLQPRQQRLEQPAVSRGEDQEATKDIDEQGVHGVLVPVVENQKRFATSKLRRLTNENKFLKPAAYSAVMSGGSTL